MEQHAAAQQSPSASTELQQVSRQYLEHFNTPQFLAYLQPNTQIIWFGRTLQGVPRLESFLKYLKNCQYELKNVQPPQQCEPFETKQEHFETRRIMPPCKYRTHPLNRVTSTTLKPYAESDVEQMSDGEEEAGPSTPQRCVTPVAQQVPAQLTPPTTRRKLPKPNIPSSDSDSSSSWTTASSSDDSSDDTDNEDFEETIAREAKRPRTQAMPAFSYLRYFPSQKKFDKWLKRETVDYGSGKMATPAYGEIKYLEMTAFLRCSLKVPFTSPAFKNCDKEIKINMSYRRNPDNTFVFPMIVYDLPYTGEAAAAAREAATVAMPTRRNLMLEYGNEAVEDDDDAEDDSPEPVSSTTEVLGRNIETQLNATIRGATPIVEGDNDTRLSTAITSTTTTTSLLEATNDLVNTLESTDFSVSALRTPIKLSNTPPATPKRKPRIHSAPMAAAASLKRLQDSPSKQVPAPKRSAARCLRL